MTKLTKVMSIVLVAVLLICTLTACGCAHVDADHNGLCDKCRKPQEVVHDDTNPKDGICDTCKQLIVHEHVDTNDDEKCDICNGLMDHNHVDADHDGKCDIEGCGLAMKVQHEDKTGDYKCDVCGAWTVREPNFSVPAGGFKVDEPVTITFYHTMGTNLNTVLDMYIEEFEALFPNITVEWTQVGGYNDVRDQIQKELTVGGGPNIAYCYPDHVALYNVAKAVTTLDNLIDSKVEVTHADGTKETIGLTDAQKADFIPGFYNEGRAFGDGLMYTMPFSKSTEVLYYNKTFFTDNGLKLPTHWWCDSNCPAGCDTSLEYVCRKIKEIDPNSVPLGYDSESNWFITMCEQLGTPYTSASGEKFLFDNAENKAFLKKFKEWYNQGLLTTQEIYGAYTSGLFINQDPTTPRSYMSIGSSAGATHQRPAALEDGSYPFEVGIASIPQVDPSNPKVISQGPSVCIFQKDNPQEVIASWLFVKFLTTSVEFQAEFGLASGYMPVLQSVRNEDLAEYDAAGKPLNAIATYIEYLKLADGGLHIAELSTKVALDQANAYYVSPAFNGSSAARDQVGMLVENVFLLNKTGAELDAAIDELFAAAIYQCYYSIGESVPQK